MSLRLDFVLWIRPGSAARTYALRGQHLLLQRRDTKKTRLLSLACLRQRHWHIQVNEYSPPNYLLIFHIFYLAS
jgi:hypothetical protein